MKIEPLLTAQQIAERLGVCHRQALRLMAEMRSINIGRGAKMKTLRVLPEELERWIQARTVQPEYGKLEIIKPPKRKHIDYTACGLTPEGKIPYRRAERRKL